VCKWKSQCLSVHTSVPICLDPEVIYGYQTRAGHRSWGKYQLLTRRSNQGQNLVSRRELFQHFFNYLAVAYLYRVEWSWHDWWNTQLFPIPGQPSMQRPILKPMLMVYFYSWDQGEEHCYYCSFIFTFIRPSVRSFLRSFVYLVQYKRKISKKATRKKQTNKQC